MKKPEPISKHIVCSECGLPWDAHTKRLKSKSATPTHADCIALLKAELAKRPHALQQYAMSQAGTSGTASNFYFAS